ncbi:DUF4031 domain-containing protein [Rhizosphaericola mali]|nr:DUF4031 domain-containing protein [Rhizosphaericola mali]
MVYIDDFNAPFGRMRMCHMIADTTDELLQMCDKIGVARKWIQYPNTTKEHFDICLSKKQLAIKFGAKEVGFRELSNIIQNREQSHTLIATPTDFGCIVEGGGK